MSKPVLTDLSLAELGDFIRARGQPDYRARQVFKWVYQRLVTSFDEMTDLPAAFRQTLAQDLTLLSLHPTEELTSGDGKTVKVLFELEDKKTIEGVLMLAEEGGEAKKRNTACVSSQVGCQIRCPFCATGQQGFERNLTSGEIVEQALYFQRQLASRAYGPVQKDITADYLTNIVYMGMGEPLANYEAVKKSIETLITKDGMAFGMRRITVSTCGLVPQIKQLADEKFHVELAVSLHAPENSLRDRLVPINKKFPIEMLMQAVGEYFEKTGRRPTFEYTLFRGLNDSAEQAMGLARLLRGRNCLVNLILPNPTSNKTFQPSNQQQVRVFQDELDCNGVLNTVRFPRGVDIDAACGQLRSRSLLKTHDGL